MERDAHNKFKGSDIKLPDPFLKRCKAKKRHYSRDSFLVYEGEPSKRRVADSLSGKCIKAGSTSSHAAPVCDPFEDYLNTTESCPSGNVATTVRKKKSITVSILSYYVQ
jgi:hypothetical protein